MSHQSHESGTQSGPEATTEPITTEAAAALAVDGLRQAREQLSNTLSLLVDVYERAGTPLLDQLERDLATRKVNVPYGERLTDYDDNPIRRAAIDAFDVVNDITRAVRVLGGHIATIDQAGYSRQY